MKPARIHLHLITALLLGAACANPVYTQWSHTTAASGGFAAALMSNSHSVLVGLENGGVYRSTDDGTTWECAWAGLNGRGPGGYAFVDLGSRILVSTGVGIAVSTNEGLSWSDANNGLPVLGSVITGFDVDPSGTVYASGSEGVYHSNDSGVTWIRSATGLTDSLMASIRCAGSYVFAATYETGVFRSSDKGSTWQPTSNGLGSGQGMRITDLTSMPGRVVAATRGGAYYSTDYGDTWNLATSGLDSRTVSAVAAFDTILVAGTYGSGAFRSTDKGVTWVSSSTGWESGNVRAFCMHNGTLFGGNYGLQTLFRSTNYGVTWAPIGNGITGRYLYSFAANSSRIFAANMFGVEASSDNGQTWFAPPPLYGRAFFSVHLKDPVVFAGSAGTGPYLSTDNGATWDTANGGTSGIGPVEVLSMTSDSLFVYAGTYHGVFRSSDNGASWERTINGLSDTTVYAFCSARGHLYAGTRTGIFVSTNHGSSWAFLSNGAPTYNVKSIVSLDSIILAATEYGSVPSTFRSTDFGLSWSPVTNGVDASNAVFQTLAVDGKSIFGGSTTQGVWLSIDMGITWSNISAGLEGPALKVVALAVSGNIVYSGTKGGIWIRPLSQVVDVEDGGSTTIGDLQLMQNYPNPFNPTTRISYSVGRVVALSGSEGPASNVRLAVYDLLGREVAVLAHEKKPAGTYEVEWNAAGLASGVYIYRLVAGSRVESRKMMVMK
jgi:photosystem II stability/assembly factor-like uncharacterized protein